MIQETIKKILPVRSEFTEKAQKRLDSLTKPQGSLGRLEEFARRLVVITESTMPVLDKKVIFTFAGDHGVTEEGISAYPGEVTKQMVLNILHGGAGINVLARHTGAVVVVVDIGVKGELGKIAGLVSKKVVSGTGNIRKGHAMTKYEAARCIEVGISLAEEYAVKGYGIFGTGEMGIGNTTPSSAIAAVLTGRQVSEVTGKGTGIGDETLKHKIKVIQDAISINKPDPEDPVDVLAKIGALRSEVSPD